MPRQAVASFDYESLHHQELTDEQLSDLFRRQAGTQALDAWLGSPLRRGTLAGQRFLRLARHANSIQDLEEERQRVLFGIPLVVKKGLSASEWENLQVELEAGLSFAWGALVRLAVQPSDTQALHEQGVGPLKSWASTLMDSLPGAPDWSLAVASANEGRPAVWVGAVDVEAQAAAALFYRITPEQARPLRPLFMRLEALAEESGGEVQLLPPSGYWNALSFSRMGLARMAIKEHGTRSSNLELTLEAGMLQVTQDGYLVWSLEMPEETPYDIQPLTLMVQKLKK